MGRKTVRVNSSFTHARMNKWTGISLLLNRIRNMVLKGFAPLADRRSGTMNKAAMPVDGVAIMLQNSHLVLHTRWL